MNFQEFWYGDKDKKIVGQDKYQPINTYKKPVEFGWNACKQEVLKILEKNKFHIVDTQLQRDAEMAIDLECIREIKEL